MWEMHGRKPLAGIRCICIRTGGIHVRPKPEKEVLTMEGDYYDEDGIDDFYRYDMIEEYVDEDMISSAEEGFMLGWLDTDSLYEGREEGTL